MAKKTQAEIEFKLLNSQYKKGISEINKDNASLKSSLKLCEAQFQATGDKSEYLKTKCDVLTKQYDLSKQKVKETADALEQSKKTLGENATETKKLETNLKNATVDMYNLGVKSKDAQNEMSKFSNASEALDKVSKKSKEASDALKGVSVSALAVAGASMAATMHLDDGYDTIIKKTGATGDALEGLNTSANNIFTSMPFDMKNVGTAIGEVNTRFLVTGESLENLSTLFLEFADINETDLNASIGNTQKIMSQWNIDISQTESLLGLFTKKSQETGISVDTLMGNVQTNGFVFKEMGLSIEESVTLMAQFESSGIESDSMLVGLKKAAANYTKEGKSMNDGLSSLITRLQNSSSESEATAEAYALFGNKAGGSFVTAAKEGRISLDNLSTDLSTYGTVVADTFNETQDPWDKATTTMNNLEVAGSNLGSSFFNVIAPAFDFLTESIKKANDWFVNLDDDTKNLIAGGILFVGTLSSLALGISIVASICSTLSTGFAVMKTALSFLSIEKLKDIALTTQIGILYAKDAILKGASTVATVAQTVATGAWNIVCGIATVVTTALGAAFTFLTSPIGLVVLAIAAVIAIGVLLYQNWDVICSYATESWGFIQAKFEEFDSFLTNVFATDWTNAFGVFGNVLNVFSANFSNIWNAIKQIFSGIIDFVAGVFTGDWSRAWDGVVGIFGGIFSGLGAIIKAPINGVIGLINSAIDGINSISIDIPEWVPGIGGQHWGANFGHIGYLANGGMVNSPTLSWVGEGKYDEAVIPLSERSVTPLAKMVVDLMPDNFGVNNLLDKMVQMMSNIQLNIVADMDGTPLRMQISRKQAIAVKRGRNG